MISCIAAFSLDSQVAVSQSKVKRKAKNVTRGLVHPLHLHLWQRWMMFSLISVPHAPHGVINNQIQIVTNGSQGASPAVYPSLHCRSSVFSNTNIKFLLEKLMENKISSHIWCHHKQVSTVRFIFLFLSLRYRPFPLG